MFLAALASLRSSGVSKKHNAALRFLWYQLANQ
jgi:hypothetical protein